MKWTKLVLLFCAHFILHTAFGQIVYSGPKNIATLDYTISTRFVTTGFPFVIDFNGDGIGDISFYGTSGGSPGPGGDNKNARLASLNQGAFAVDAAGNPKPFQDGDPIGGLESWLGSPADISVAQSFNTHGPLLLPPTFSFLSDPGPQFIGVRVTVDSVPYYGWVEYRSIYTNGLFGASSYGYVFGWAYETRANMPIIAGDVGAVPEPSAYQLMGVTFVFCLVVWRFAKRGQGAECQFLSFFGF